MEAPVPVNARGQGRRAAAHDARAVARTAPSPLPSLRGSRGLLPGSRRGLAVTAAVLAAGAVAAAVVLSQPGGQGAAARYGGIPSWLPKAKVTVGRVASASAAHPWLAIEGDTVSVRLAHGRAAVTAVGPAVPESGRFPVPASSPCTFTVTFAAAAGSVPLRARDFSFLDELGRIHSNPRVRLLDGGALPRSLGPGRPVSITVHAVLPTGNGRLRWAPAGARPIVSWDFDVEID